MEITHDKRLKCTYCNKEELELKPNQDLAIVKESNKLDKPDDAHTVYIDFYCKECKGYHQLYITTYRGSTYVGWNKSVNSLDTFYTRKDKTKEVAHNR